MKTTLINNKITKACLEILCFNHCRLESCRTELPKDKIWSTIFKTLGNSYFPNKSQNNIFILFLCMHFILMLQLVHFSTEDSQTIPVFSSIGYSIPQLLKKSSALLNNDKHLLSLHYVLGALLVTLFREESHSKENISSQIPYFQSSEDYI